LFLCNILFSLFITLNFFPISLPTQLNSKFYLSYIVQIFTLPWLLLIFFRKLNTNLKTFILIFLLYIIVGTVSFLLNSSTKQSFYFLQYFIFYLSGISLCLFAYFIAISNKNLSFIKIGLQSAFFLCVGTVLWQLYTKNYFGHYGPVPIGLDGSAAAAGIYFYSFTVLYTLINKKINEKLCLFLALSVLGGFLTGNRTFVYAQIIFLFCYFVFEKKILFLSILFLAILCSFSLLEFNKNRFNEIYDSKSLRQEMIVDELNMLNSKKSSKIFGQGFGFIDSLYNEKRGMHSQISRSYIETGLLGCLVLVINFFLLLYFLCKKEKYNRSLNFSFLFSFGASFLAYDSLSIPRASAIFFLLIGILFAFQDIEKQ